MFVAVAVLSTACGRSKAERCEEIYTQGLMNELLESRERRLGYRDSLTPPPPTPKDLTWYDDNCYRGKPR